ncbi:GntR family transcriptional regulator/MocR family aminotransferase [Luteimonas sp. J16]|jgi:GntR family transcriptional regulator/MocR family aminotransferase|uniref:MocR-like pyridoxine biosynthesis transcription factor PdxR n=1 Tax=unclassified Luteimonas TaxID=2629088 RepID=UPI00047DE127|nr:MULTISPECIES: PLP-dependent aminotransferase family protein [unclassified Luteimonas]TWG93018.1 GntR family transcriptional regulator/MocR family aminotransferase [Luteimonas sp. J16]
MILDGHGPLHAQLTRALRAGILQGRFAAGTRLPPTRWFAEELGVSRNTVLAAYEQLRAEGFIEGRVGSGSYVARQRFASADVRAPQPETVAAQSRYAARARAVYDPDGMPGRAVAGIRYSFQYGVPLTNPLLTTAWARALSHAVGYTRPDYPGVRGLPELRAAVCDYLARRRGIHADPDDVLVVAGTQQALSLTMRVLLDPGEAAAIEDPHYFAIRMGLEIHGARVRTVPVDAEGLCVDLLPEPAPRLVCVTPSHQFPSGAVMSLARRMELLDYAARHGSWIFEDDYDGEFRYDSRPLAALRSLDRQGRVVYVGTFSKAIFPALRMGYLLMPPALRHDFLAAKWAEDFGSPAIEQVALANFMRDGGFERHLRRSARTLKERRATLIAGLRACSRGRLEIADAHAGMHLVVWLRDRSRADGDALIELARSRGLGLYPIAPYYADPPDRAGLLMGYCGLSVREIREAMWLFAGCLDELFPTPSA